MRRSQFFQTVLRLALPATLAALAVSAAGPPAPYLVPWLKVTSGDARVRGLAAKAAAPLSPNAPGLLLALEPQSREAGSTGPRDAIRALARDAHRAGWRWGLDLELPDIAVPADVRAAEAATVEDLWPGLGELLKEA
ncbi:MAG TPA: hypothetical protein VFZ57_04520, partial [Thermoanaerobaculia bacterium]|nr:hypothetical protein [Thermoanaerobaculia bacterium]